MKRWDWPKQLQLQNKKNTCKLLQYVLRLDTECKLSDHRTPTFHGVLFLCLIFVGSGMKFVSWKRNYHGDHLFFNFPFMQTSLENNLFLFEFQRRNSVSISSKYRRRGIYFHFYKFPLWWQKMVSANHSDKNK